jgi:GNAT superfamily N-acetyltransferase
VRDERRLNRPEAPSVHVVPLDPSRLTAWAGLFEAAHSTCFCRYWHFEGDKNAWLARSAFEPQVSCEEQSALVRAGDPAGRGLLALESEAEGARAVGWMKLAPRATLPKLRRLPVYRSLDLGDDAGVYAIGCFLVDPAWRHRGVARALVTAAEKYARGWGATALEAYPRRTPDRLYDEEAWMGPESLFLAVGFVPVHDVAPYPVLRKTL